MIPTSIMKCRTESRSAWDEKFIHDRGISFGEDSPFGDGSSIFDRMRMRISKGEEWNVREAYVSQATTVMETLKAWSSYVVMDSESAEETSKLLEEQIEFVKTWREELPDRIAAVQDNAYARDSIMMEAFNFLSETGGGLESLSLNGPSIANYHLYGLRVYDSPFARND